MKSTATCRPKRRDPSRHFRAAPRSSLEQDRDPLLFRTTLSRSRIKRIVYSIFEILKEILKTWSKNDWRGVLNESSRMFVKFQQLFNLLNFSQSSES